MTWVINQKLCHSSYLPFDIFSSAWTAASRETKPLKKSSQISQSCCHAIVNKVMMPYTTQCTDPDNNKPVKIIASLQQWPGFYRAPVSKGLLSCTLLMGLKLNVPLFLQRWTQGVHLPSTESSGEWWGRGVAGDSPAIPSCSRRFIHHIKRWRINH